MHLILIGHEKFVGKSSLASVLATEYLAQNRKVIVVGFAFHLKEICHQLFKHHGLKCSNYYDNHYELKDVPLPNGRTPRSYWIEIGNKIREIDDAVWFDNWIGMGTDVLISPDFRYLPEYEYSVRSGHKVTTICVRRDCDSKPDVADNALKYFKNWNYMLRNEGSREDWQYRCETFARQFILETS